jgi:leucyl aminopeptidase (aminopeptidase T)
MNADKGSETDKIIQRAQNSAYTLSVLGSAQRLKQMKTRTQKLFLGESGSYRAKHYGITRFTKEILFDEKMGGTIHLALGRSYFETGGLNQSGVHWDILKDMKKDGEIYADKELFYKNSKFIV